MKISRDDIGRYARRSWVARVIRWMGRKIMHQLHRIHVWALPYGEKMSLVMAILLLVIFGGVLGIREASNSSVVEADGKFSISQVKVDTLALKLKEKQDKVLDTLEKCENTALDNEDSHGFAIYDNNSRGTLTGIDALSFGPYKWKTDTVKDFVKLRDGRKITNREAIAIAIDDEDGRELARFAIFETQGGIFHWYNCEAKHNLAAEVTKIKEWMK